MDFEVWLWDNMFYLKAGIDYPSEIFSECVINILKKSMRNTFFFKLKILSNLLLSFLLKSSQPKNAHLVFVCFIF